MSPCLASLMGCLATGGPCSRCRLAGPAVARVSLSMQTTSALWQAAHSICKHCWTCWLCVVHCCSWRLASPRPRLWCPLWREHASPSRAMAGTVNKGATNSLLWQCGLLFCSCQGSQLLRRWCSQGMPSCSAMTQFVQIDALPKHPDSCYTSWL